MVRDYTDVLSIYVMMKPDQAIADSYITSLSQSVHIFAQGHLGCDSQRPGALHLGRELPLGHTHLHHIQGSVPFQGCRTQESEQM